MLVIHERAKQSGALAEPANTRFWDTVLFHIIPAGTIWYYLSTSILVFALESGIIQTKKFSDG